MVRLGVIGCGRIGRVHADSIDIHPRVEFVRVFDPLGMLSAANQLPTSVRFSGAEHTEVAPPCMNFFLDRYTPAYRAELDHFITAIETASPPRVSLTAGPPWCSPTWPTRACGPARP